MVEPGGAGLGLRVLAGLRGEGDQKWLGADFGNEFLGQLQPV